MSKKLDIETVKKIVFDIAGYTLIDETYKNSRTKMTAVDGEGYKYFFTLENIKFAKASRIVDKSNPYSIENIRLWLLKHGDKFDLITEDYKGNGSKNRESEMLELKCKNGHTLHRTWNDIRCGGIRCETCRMRFTNHSEFVSFILDKYNGEYEVVGEYINSQTNIKMRHVICGREYCTLPENAANGHGCPNPLCCKKRGEEHYRYNPELTDEERKTIRSLMPEYQQWKTSVYKKYNYTCDICSIDRKNRQKIRMCAHHLFSWNKYPNKRFDVSNGIVMCAKCHVDFHQKYGYGNNTKDQYLEYKSDYDNTEVSC